MSMDDFDAAIELIELDREQADFDGPKSDALLEQAEHALGLAFPPSYRAFLSRFGCGDFMGTEFYGVISDDFSSSAVPDAIWLTLRLRQMSRAASTLIVIGSTGDGGYYAIDCSEPSGDGERPVVEWWPGSTRVSVVASDFGQFFLRSVRDAMRG